MKTAAIALTTVLGTAAYAELRYAYVDVRQVVEESDAGKAIKKKLQGEVERRQKELDAQMAELKRLRGELDKQRPILSASAIDQKERDLQQRLGLLQERMLRMQSELDAEQQAAV